MKKVFKWILPLCLLLIVFTQLIDYYLHKEIQPALLVVVVALFPAALKGLEYKISKKIERVMVILAVIGMIYVVWSTFF